MTNGSAAWSRTRGSPGCYAGEATALSPIEQLTDRYATGRARIAWQQLAPMTALEAFSAVQADPEAGPEAIAAALTLLPELHGALDAAAADRKARADQA
ncbi:hypothetical protein ACFH04_00255 [Streptomyces noboritoensis]|uniref:Uncharacterized protein n=1 Tax=Streptomyces noboritoensis TaxID=67337 RepID=A0ABV6T8R7_9ACTN